MSDRSHDKHQTVARSIQKLAASLAPLSAGADSADDAVHALAAAHAVCQQERKQADLPFVTLPVAAPKLDPRASRMTSLVLDTLSSFIEAVEASAAAAGDAAVDASAAATACSELCDMLGAFAPASMFEEWSPAPLPAERLITGAAAATASADATPAVFAAGAAPGSDDYAAAAGVLAAGARLDALAFGVPGSCGTDPDAPLDAAAAASVTALSGDGWRAPATGNAIWGVTFAAPTPVSSVRLFWMVRRLAYVSAMAADC